MLAIYMFVHNPNDPEGRGKKEGREERGDDKEEVSRKRGVTHYQRPSLKKSLKFSETWKYNHLGFHTASSAVGRG